jgi:hypothetical protein
MPRPQVAHIASPVSRTGLLTMRGAIFFGLRASSEARTRANVPSSALSR